jgi:hypothetical protein
MPTPIFVENYATLKAELRLKGSVADEQIGGAVKDAHLEIHDRLTEARIAEILTANEVDPPTTAEERLRMRASRMEVKLVRLYLMSVLPVLFMEGADLTQAWNHDAAFRMARRNEIDELAERLRAEVDEDMAHLAGETVAEAESRLRMATIEPAVAPPLPGVSLEYAAW